MTKSFNLALAAGLVCTLTACGEDAPPPKQEQARSDHVWRGQTEALQTAKDVAADVNVQQATREERINRARE